MTKGKTKEGRELRENVQIIGVLENRLRNAKTLQRKGKIIKAITKLEKRNRRLVRIIRRNEKLEKKRK